MAELPQDHADRVADLEDRIARLESDLAANARRDGDLVFPRNVWPAITTEPSTGYPANTRCDLPILFRDISHSSGVISYTARTAESPCRAISRFGWLPPETPVAVVYDKSQWWIVDAPTLLHGVASTEIAAAAWGGSCTTYTLGDDEVQVWRKNGSGVYVPQYYDDGTTAVLLPVNSTAAGEVEPDTFLTFGRNADNDWVVMVEPCDGACS